MMKLKFMYLLVLVFIANESFASEKISLGSKYFCTIDGENYILSKGKTIINQENAETLIEEFDSKAKELQQKGFENQDEKMFASGLKIGLLGYKINECINKNLHGNNTEAGDLSIKTLSLGPHPAFEVFDRYIDVFGIKLYASPLATDEGLIHAANIMAEYLDNDEDGQVDNPLVLKAMRKKNAAMIVFDNPNSEEYTNFFSNFIIPEGFQNLIAVGEVHTDQMAPNSAAYEAGVDTNKFDATLEEVLHLITHEGYDDAYPKIFAETKTSSLGKAMDASIIAGNYSPDANSGELSYNTQCTEYIYWAITSYLGAQDFEGRLERIENEWKLNTKEKMEEKDPAVINLITNPSYKIPSSLPDGNYAIRL